MKLFDKKIKTCKAVEFIYRYARESKRDERYKRAYRNIASHLKEYECDRNITILSNAYSYKIVEDYIEFLKDKNLSKSTIKCYVDKTSFMFRKMARHGYDIDFSFEDIQINDENNESVYVSSSEIEVIYNMNIRDKERDVVRDRFVCNCLIGMRYSDFNVLSISNIQNNTIVRKTQKTGTLVIVPIHRIVSEILKKYGNNFPPYSKSMQNYNKIVKTVCKQAGLIDKVLVERTIGHRVVRKTYARYQLISSHTARRSFATNAYLAGIQSAKIMLITGHKTEQSFFKYIRIGKKENARELAEHPFFK